MTNRFTTRLHRCPARRTPGFGVDPSSALLDAFAARAARIGIAHTEIRGAWPDAATETPIAEIAVCHHVVHNVADLASFARALTDHAADRAVIELTAVPDDMADALLGRAAQDRPIRPADRRRCRRRTRPRWA